MLKNLELAVGTDTYIPEVEGIVPFHNCDSDEDTKELDAIIVTIDNDTNTIQELKAFQKTLPAYGINQQTYEWFLQNIHSKIQFPFELPAIENLSSTGKNKVLAKQLYYAIEEMNQSLLQKIKTKIVEWWKNFINFVSKAVQKIRQFVSSNELVQKCRRIAKYKFAGTETYKPSELMPYDVPTIEIFNTSMSTIENILNNLASIFEKEKDPFYIVSNISRYIDVQKETTVLTKLHKTFWDSFGPITAEKLQNYSQNAYVQLGFSYDRVQKSADDIDNRFKKININTIMNAFADDQQHQQFYLMNHKNLGLIISKLLASILDVGKGIKQIIKNINSFENENMK